MKNIKFLFFILITFLSCNKKKELQLKSNAYKQNSKYKYEKIIIQYDLGNDERQDLYAYVDNKNQDTIGSQEIFYKNNVLDSSKSCFYQLRLDWKENKIFGRIEYYTDTTKYGKMTGLLFKVKSNYNGENRTIDFIKEEPINNIIEFEFPNESDSLTGIIFVQHLKITDTISEKGDKAYHLSEKLHYVDNYSLNNNPFIKTIKLEKYDLEKYGL